MTSGVAVFACSLAMFFSIWVKKPHQALIPTYAVLGLWCGAVLFYVTLAGSGRVIFADPSLQGLLLSNPLYAVAASYAEDDRTRWIQPLAFLATMLTISAALVLISMARLRKAVIGQSNAPKKRPRADAPLRVLDYLPGPKLDANPILWREWHRKKPGRWTGRAWTVYGVVSLLASAYAIFVYFTDPRSYEAQGLAALVNTAGVTIGLLLLTISATTSLAEERDRGSLDIIMTTPLSTVEILKGKWLGTFAMVPRLAILPLWVASGLALITGEWLAPLVLLALILAYSAFITSLGLALATWIPRVGRAIAVGLFAVVFLNVTLVMGYSYLTDSPPSRQAYYGQYSGPGRDWLLLGSPIYGISEATTWAGLMPWLNHGELEEYRSGSNTGYGSALAWVVALSGLAGLILAATIASFDRCLGRMTTDIQIDEPPRLDPEAKAKSASLLEPA